MKQYTLRQIKSSHQNVRTQEMTGTIIDLPKVGNNFIITNKSPLSIKEGYRLIRTSAIISTEKTEDGIIFQTQNSTYLLLEEGGKTPTK